MGPCRAHVTWGSGSGPCPPGRPTPCSTSPASGSATRRSTATSRAPPEGRGVARTGVTVLVLAEDAYHRPVPAGGAVLNGAGECTGLPHRRRVGLGRDAGLPDLDPAARPGLRLGLRDRARGATRGRATDVVIPVVGECDDSCLNDCRRMQVDARRRRRAARRGAGARAAPPTPPDEGAVGAGTGMSCLGFKGGIGTASRVTAEGHTVARPADDQLRRPRGARRDRRAASAGGCPPAAGRSRRSRPGSCIGIVVTDAAVDGASCARLARRVGLGLARAGSVAHHGSGEIFLASAPACGSTATAGPTATAVVDRPRARPALRRGGRGRRGGRAQLDVHRPDHHRPRRQHQRVAALPRGPRAAGRRPRMTGTRARSGSRSATASSSPRRSTCPTRRRVRSRACSRRCPTARTTSPRRTPPATSVLRDRTGTPCAGSTCAAPGRRRATPLDEYPPDGAARPGRGDRLAGRAGVVRRQRRHVRHVVLRLQLPPDRLRAAPGAQGDLRDLRHRRPLDRRRALARRRAAAGRPRRLLPLHDADVRAAARAGGLGRRGLGGRSGGAGWRPTSRGC